MGCGVIAMKTHTPGPWVQWNDSNTVSLAGDKFHRIADCMESADARLIAAAPDLLAALAMIEPFLRGGLRDLAAATIAKAEGRT